MTERAAHDASDASGRGTAPGGPEAHDVAAAPDALVAWCRAACLDLPDATVDSPFGPGSEVYRVHRKMFALVSQSPRVSEHRYVNLKADPDEIPLLVATHPFVLPGFHMSKTHWVSVVLGPGTDRELLGELVEDSYDLVVLGLPQRLRTTLGRRAPGESFTVL